MCPHLLPPARLGQRMAETNTSHFGTTHTAGNEGEGSPNLPRQAPDLQLKTDCLPLQTGSEHM